MSKRSNVMERKLTFREWAIMLTIPFVLMLSAYNTMAIGGLLPLLRDTFNLSDSAAGTIKTFATVARGCTFATMWLFGDFLPKKTAFLLSVTMWIILSFATVLATSDQFWLFVLLHSIAAGLVEVFSITATVILADHFKGKYLAWAFSVNSIVGSIAGLLAAPVNGIFVDNHSGWRLGMILGPFFAIPFLLLSAVFLRHSKPPSIPHPMFMIQNSLSIFRIPSFNIVAISTASSMLYSLNLGFWWSTLQLDAMETYPDVFLGISYPLLTSIISFVGFAGMLLATFLVPSLITLLKSQALELPIIYAVSALFATLNYILQLTMLTKNLLIFLASFFIDGIAGCANSLVYIQIELAIVPAHQRSSALALSRMMIAIANMPSAQIFGAISDYFRGDSTTTPDHLEVLQKTFLYTWPIQLASAVLCFVLLRFYRRDIQKAHEENRQENEEQSPLISNASLMNFE